MSGSRYIINSLQAKDRMMLLLYLMVFFGITNQILGPNPPDQCGRRTPTISGLLTLLFTLSAIISGLYNWLSSRASSTQPGTMWNSSSTETLKDVEAQNPPRPPSPGPSV